MQQSRSKTINTTKEKREICAVITPEMQAIINKWGNKEKSPDNYIFPYLIGNETPIQQKAVIKDIIRRINKRLKKIGNELGVSGISTYTARHSFAGVLKRSGANIAYISESLGHSDLKTTENYLASFEREEREKNAKLLTNFRE
ncbi:Tyrosine recombinase XerC, partial [termite gut metagenome]